MRVVRDLRLIPLVIMVIACFGTIKIAAILLDGGYLFRDDDDPNRISWAQEMFNFPAGRTPAKFNDSAADITGSVDAPKEELAGKSPGEVLENPPAKSQDPPSVSERAVLERLQARRQELDTRAREIEIRENLLKAHEQSVEARVEELKGLQARASEAERQKDADDAARFKGIVTMYENMKPKDAAKIFDGLEMTVLLDVASHMKPQKMSDVLAQMQPSTAERLTVELARRTGSDAAGPAADLPKIEGRPTPDRTK